MIAAALLTSAFAIFPMPVVDKQMETRLLASTVIVASTPHNAPEGLRLHTMAGRATKDTWFRRLLRPVLGLEPHTRSKYFENGSGVVVGDGLVLTAAHVIYQPHSAFYLRFHDGRRTPAQVVAHSAKLDAALLRFDLADQPPPLPLASLAHAEPGIPVTYAGNPGGRAWWVERGMFSTVDADTIGVEGMLEPGISGGPVVNEAGELLGLAAFGFPEYFIGPRADVAMRVLSQPGQPKNLRCYRPRTKT